MQDTTAPHASSRALIAACAAAFAFSANYTNHAPLLAALRAQFGFDQASAGFLTTGVFLTHALMQIPGGRLADRFGAPRVMFAALAWVAAGNIAIAFSTGYSTLLFWKVFTGFGTGACFAGGARYIVSSFSGRALHAAQGLYGGAVLLGSGFVIFAVPRLLDALGWSGAFVACAAAAIAALLIWIFFAPRPKPVPAPAAALTEMMASPHLWALGIVQMASFGLVVVVGAWITALLKNDFGLTLKSAGLMGSLVLLLGIVSRPAGGSLLHRFSIASVVRAALLLNAAACFALAAGHSLALTFVAIVALGAGCGMPYAGVFNRAAALFPGRAGAAMGFVNMLGILMILAGAPAVGFLADSTGNFRTSFLALGAFSAAASAASLAMREP